MSRYFFDVPVYRLPQEKYYQKRDADIWAATEGAWRGLEPTDEQLRRHREQREAHYYKSYGPWMFNEIVGYIRLHFLGSQIRGEYFSAEKARTRLSRTRVFTCNSLKLASETNLWRPYDNKGIFVAIEEYLDRCQKELRKGRFIDRSNLQTLGPYMNWVALLEQKESEAE